MFLKLLAFRVSLVFLRASTSKPVHSASVKCQKLSSNFLLRLKRPVTSDIESVVSLLTRYLWPSILKVSTDTRPRRVTSAADA
ncbi:hypothetical protein DFH11DRAFT_1602382, partial [Phellopilus nigrolimitatus]